jgi:hypothetical protein
LPCPDFEGFLLANSLRTHNVSFIMDLPDYILRMGRQILGDNASSSDGVPDLSWLPRSPSETLPSLLSQGPNRSASRPPNVTMRAHNTSRPPSCPNPDGLHAPLFFSIGGLDKSGVFSPLTSSDFCPIRGGSPPRDYILTQRSSSETTPLPSSSASIRSMAPTLVDSFDTVPSLVQTPSLVHTPFKSSESIFTIKDKPLDMGIKPITDKDSWTDAKKIIDAHLRRAPYWPGESKQLITTDDKAAASVWWEEVIAFYCKPPVSDLFVEDSCFDGKGSEMIAHINQHFNPSGAVDSLGYIFDLIDIKQSDQESVITLKARFSKIFSALKMGGISIDSALQVGFMLRALLHRYQAVVQEFRLGCHSLSAASLQTVVEQCTNYDKDPWKGPVGKDGKVPRPTPSANAAGSKGEGPCDVLSAKSFNYHFGQWKKALKEQTGKSMVCFDTARNEHNTCDCHVLKNLGFKIDKRTPSDNPQDAASRVATEIPPSPAPSAPAPAPSSAPPQASGDLQPGSMVAPGAFSAATKYDFGDKFDYEGKSDGAMYVNKSNQSSIAYPLASCSHTTLDHDTIVQPDKIMGGSLQDSMGGLQSSKTVFANHTSQDPQGVNTIYLPKTVLSLLANPPARPSVSPTRGSSSTRTSLVVADTGATDHMLPDKSTFISYHTVTGRRVHMGNNSFAPIAGHGMAIVSLNGKKILIRDCLHIPDLRHPLYSLRAHQCQCGCGFIGMFGLGMHVFFPSFILEVDTATDCHLQYVPVGRMAQLSDLDYVQPKPAPQGSVLAMAATTQAVPTPAMIEPDDGLDDQRPTILCIPLA